MLQRAMASRAIAVALVVLVSAGCAAGARSTPREHPAESVPAAHHLPADVLALVHAPSLAALADRAGRQELVSRFRQEHERLVVDAVRALGVSAVTPEGLTELGIDPSGPATLAMLDERTAVLCATVESAERLKTAVYRAAGVRPDDVEVIGGHLLVELSSAALLLAGDSALLFVGPRRHAHRLARASALLPLEERLVRQRELRAALAGVERADLVAYASLRKLGFGWLGLDPRWRGSNTQEVLEDIERRHAQALAAARRRGAPVDEIVRIDDDHRRAAVLAREDIGTDAYRRLFDGLLGLGVAAELRGRELTVQAELGLDEAYAFAGLLRPGGRLRALPTAIGAPPAIWLGLRVDPVVALRMIEDQFSFTAASLVLGVRVPEKLRASLDGQVDLVVAPAAAAGGPPRFAVVVGLRAAEPARELLDVLFNGPLRRQARKQGAGWVVDEPAVGTLFVDITPAGLVVATDAAVHERLSGALAAGGADAERASTEGAIVLDVDLGAALSLLAPRLTDGAGAQSDVDDRPKNDEIAMVEAELEAIAPRLLHAEQALRDALEANRRVLATTGGVATFVVRDTDRGLRLEGVYRAGEPSLAATVATLVERASRSPDARALAAEVRELRAERDDLRDELRRLHEQVRRAAEPAEPAQPEEPAEPEPAPE